MRKWWRLALFFVPAVLLGEPITEYYIGEMKSQILEEETPEHYGFLFLKRTFYPDENRFVDKCLISAHDGETFQLEQTSELTGDLHAIILSGEDGMISGTGELVGFPWHWTSLQEKVELSIESPIEIEVKNTMEDETMFSIASVFTIESDGSREYFGMFMAELYRVDIALVEAFFSR